MRLPNGKICNLIPPPTLWAQGMPSHLLHTPHGLASQPQNIFVRSLNSPTNTVTTTGLSGLTTRKMNDHSTCALMSFQPFTNKATRAHQLDPQALHPSQRRHHCLPPSWTPACIPFPTSGFNGTTGIPRLISPIQQHPIPRPSPSTAGGCG